MKITISRLREILDEESAASKTAKKAGLVHLGFGRYGPKKGDKATHQSKDGKLVSVGGGTGGGEPEDKPFGGDTGKDADFDQDTVDTDAFNAIEAGEGENWIEEKDPSTEDMETVLRDLQRKGYKKTGDDPFKTGPETVQKYIDVLKSGKSIKYGDKYDMGDDERDTIKKKVGIMMNQFVEDNPIEEPDEKPKEKRPGGKQAEDDYHKADMMMKKYSGKDIDKAEFWAKKKRQAADAMIGRTGKELDESIKMRTISGNKRFMTKTAIPIMRKYGVKNMKANSIGGYFLELSFIIDSNKLKQLDKELKRKNRTAYGGIIEQTIRISPKHDLKLLPDGGIALYGRKGRIFLNKKQLKDLIHRLKQSKLI